MSRKRIAASRYLAVAGALCVAAIVLIIRSGARPGTDRAPNVPRRDEELASAEPTTTAMPRPRRIFVDVGAYNGDTIKKFYDSYDAVFLQPHAGHLSAQQPARARDFDDVWGWEANPAQWAALEAVSKSGYPFKLVKGAAADHEGVWLYEGGGEGGAIVERTVAEAATAASNGQTTTPVIDFSRWLKSICTADDFVMCKVRAEAVCASALDILSPACSLLQIDIESSEYSVVRKMAVDGTLCLCDRLSIEWHGWAGGTGFNDPARLQDLVEGASCAVPHLGKGLPFFYCYMARFTQWMREACPGRPAGMPALEKWW